MHDVALGRSVAERMPSRRPKYFGGACVSLRSGLIGRSLF